MQQIVPANALAHSRIATHSNTVLFSTKTTSCETNIFSARTNDN